jgi:arylsulfatase A-like enzyme
MNQKCLNHSLRLLTVVSLMTTVGNSFAQAQQGQPVGTEAGKPPYNIIFVISDQRAYRLFAGDDYSLPGIDAIARHGVTFRNHYIASAMCSPSRAAFLSGQPPQVNGVFDQMQYDFVPTLSPDLPNMGSVLKGLGYKTAYFGKFEMDKKILNPEPTINYSTAAQPYGFDVFGAGGDIGSAPRDASRTIFSSRAKVSAGCAKPRVKHVRAASPSSWSPASSTPTTSCLGMAISPANLRCRLRSRRG